MGTTRSYRFRTYDISPDPMSETTFAAACVSGDDADCGATSGEQVEKTDVERWIAEHVRDTGHSRYRRTMADYALAEPGEWQ
ncbi:MULTISPECIES: hypothetical protein [Streptomyces]|uniref:DUF7848 domain-containing protein n=1 Tax=Streptomyces TaxID=1883 RepID=UPI002E7AA5E3|nr:hypothetical protein [Streptomyces sp. BE282]MEE1734038.1 hypothetical protein [Streptomyces sp. BE282]MEE1734811.1 hypothetical protein [Streptomyces sp. BE282]